MEEVAKILILVDIVRCPPKLRPSRIGPMMRWFYDHLARLIYIDAQNWKPENVRQLQEYADHRRKSHYLEGWVGEYIMPNWSIWLRESTLYADIVTDEDGELLWNEPPDVTPMFDNFEPFPWQVCQALRDWGAFSREGLDIMSSIWSQTDFLDDQRWDETEKLTLELLSALEAADLTTDAAREEQLGVLCGHWQLPMYCIDLKRIDVPLAELQSERDANLWAEAGC